MFYRLIKPKWGKKKLRVDGGFTDNPDFVREIRGKDTLEGCFDSDYVEQKNKEGYNAYFFPNHPSTNIYDEGTNYMNGRAIDVFNFVFVDMDLKDEVYADKEEFFAKLKEFPVKPTLVVASGNGVHAYWRISDLTREDYVFTQFSLLNHFQTDESVWTVLQLMRVPGSLNTKDPNNFKQAEIIEELSSGKDYEITKILKHLEPPTEKQVKKVKDHIDKLEGRAIVDLGEDINLDELPEAFLKILHKDEKIYNLFTNPKQYYGDRSGADMSLANHLYTKKINKKDAVAVIANSQKGLSKGEHRFDYAVNTIEKVNIDRTTNHFKTVGQKLKNF